jgi:hypothetical protein
MPALFDLSFLTLASLQPMGGFLVHEHQVGALP